MRRKLLIIYFLLLFCFISVNAKEVNTKAIKSDVASKYIPTELKNGSFDNYPDLGTSASSGGSDWQTTETVTQSTFGIEGYYQIFDLNYTEDNYKKYLGIDISKGKFIEMNNYSHSVLYQDLSTKPGDILIWKLEHAPRNLNNNGNLEQNLIVNIGNSGDKLPVDSNTNISDGAIYKYDSVTGGFASKDDLLGLSVTETKKWSGVNLWKVSKGIYVVPENQKTTRFALLTEDDYSTGNFVDEVVFTTLLGNVSVEVSNDNKNIVLYGYYSNLDYYKDKKIIYNVYDKDEIIQNGSIDMTGIGDKNNFYAEIPIDDISSGDYIIKIYPEDYKDALISKDVSIEKQSIVQEDLYTNIKKDNKKTNIILIVSIILVAVASLFSIIKIIIYKKSN